MIAWLIIVAVLTVWFFTLLVCSDAWARSWAPELLALVQLVVVLLVAGEPVPDSRLGALAWLFGWWVFATTARALYIQARAR